MLSPCSVERQWSLMPKYGKKATEKVGQALHERKRGTLKSGSGQTVKSRKQAIAIALSEAREEGGKVPPRKTARKKSTPKKSVANRSGARKSTSTRPTRKKAARKSTGRKSARTRTSAKKK
jgi:Family of unknown function (DUF6496)